MKERTTNQEDMPEDVTPQRRIMKIPNKAKRKIVTPHKKKPKKSKSERKDYYDDHKGVKKLK